MKNIITTTIALICTICFMCISSCGSDDTSDVSTDTNIEAKSISIDVDMVAEGGNQTVSLSGLECEIVSAISSESWLSVQRNNYSSGTPTLIVMSNANETSTARVCTVTVTTRNGDKAILKVTQVPGITPDMDIPSNEISNQPAFSKQSRMIEDVI